jgi:hypothetical protein
MVQDGTIIQQIQAIPAFPAILPSLDHTQDLAPTHLRANKSQNGDFAA